MIIFDKTVTINETKYSQLPLAQYSDSLEEDYGILYQTKDCDPSSTATLDIDLYGQDENYNEYSKMKQVQEQFFLLLHN